MMFSMDVNLMPDTKEKVCIMTGMRTGFQGEYLDLREARSEKMDKLALKGILYFVQLT
jgi:hypothetical protein